MASVISIVKDTELFSPATLHEICILFCNANVEKVLLMKKKNEQYKLQKNVRIPAQVWEQMLENQNRSSELFLPMLFAVIKDRKGFVLQNINLSNANVVRDADLKLLVANYPRSLNIHECPRLTKYAVDIINEFGANLEHLCIGNTSHIIPADISQWIYNHPANQPTGIHKLAQSISRFLSRKHETNQVVENVQHGLLTTPKLKKLIIWDHHVTQEQNVRSDKIRISAQEQESAGGGGDAQSRYTTVDYWEFLTRDFIHTLEHLDLSCCQELKSLNFLLEAKDNLKSLHLHDVLMDYDVNTWGVLNNLSNLRFLDVSQYNELASIFPNPDNILDEIVTSLPHLIGLDISGTNLAGFEQDNQTLSSKCGITGLKSRQNNPLNFLGLLSTHYNASTRNNIPALRITGGKDMAHILNALQQYFHRPNFVTKVIRIIHEKLQDNDPMYFIPCYTLLRTLIKVLENYLDCKHTQIVAMAAVFYILKKILFEQNGDVDKTQIDRVVGIIMKSMEVYHNDVSLLRNGILILALLPSFFTLNTYADKLIPVLLRVGQAGITNSESFLVQSVAYLLHSSIHVLSDDMKKILGKKGFVHNFTDFVANLCHKKLLDCYVIIYWTTMWSLLDDIPQNVKLFVEANGVDACFDFIKFSNDCPESEQTGFWWQAQIPVFGILMNLLYLGVGESEVITQTNITSAVDILNVKNHNYKKFLIHVCGFLSHCMSKDASYSMQNPSRQDVLTQIFTTMKEMNYDKNHDYSYKHLKPLYQLLEVNDAPEIHVWVLWTLVNLLETDCEHVTHALTSDNVLNVKDLNSFIQTFQQIADTPNDAELLRMQLSETLVERIQQNIKDFKMKAVL